MYISFPFFSFYLKLMVGHFLQPCFYFGCAWCPRSLHLPLLRPPSFRGCSQSDPPPSLVLLGHCLGWGMWITLLQCSFTPPRPQFPSKRMEIDYFLLKCLRGGGNMNSKLIWADCRTKPDLHMVFTQSPSFPQPPHLTGWICTPITYCKSFPYPPRISPIRAIWQLSNALWKITLNQAFPEEPREISY